MEKERQLLQEQEQEQEQEKEQEQEQEKNQMLRPINKAPQFAHERDAHPSSPSLSAVSCLLCFRLPLPGVHKRGMRGRMVEG